MIESTRSGRIKLLTLGPLRAAEQRRSGGVRLRLVSRRPVCGNSRMSARSDTAAMTACGEYTIKIPVTMLARLGRALSNQMRPISEHRE